MCNVVICCVEMLRAFSRAFGFVHISVISSSHKKSPLSVQTLSKHKWLIGGSVCGKQRKRHFLFAFHDKIAYNDDYFSMQDTYVTFDPIVNGLAHHESQYSVVRAPDLSGRSWVRTPSGTQLFSLSLTLPKCRKFHLCQHCMVIS